jgi:2-oxoisovalerate dehydrogenase E1 component beta subunit
MARMTMIEAVRSAMDVSMARDDNVVVFGEDVGYFGGVFRCTQGLQAKYGTTRCFDTPISESGIVGTAIGMAAYGLKPCVEIQFADYMYPAYDQLTQEAARIRYRSNGDFTCPIVVRMPTGGGVRAPELHEDSPEAYYVHTPGVKVAIPSTPGDAKGLLTAALRDPDPVVVLEPKVLYRSPRGEVPEGEHVVPLGRARIAREGSDVTLIAYGAMVPTCLAAADLVDESAEVVDIRTLKPLDEETILGSVARTGRAVVVQEAPRVAGFGAEIAALLAEKAILDLRGPVVRVTGYDVPFPYWSIEHEYLPSPERVAAAARRVLAF